MINPRFSSARRSSPRAASRRTRRLAPAWMGGGEWGGVCLRGCCTLEANASSLYLKAVNLL